MPRPWWRIPLYPAVFLSAIVLLTWGGAGLPPSMLVRPLVVVIALSLAVTLLFAAILDDRDRGAIVASAVILTLLTSRDEAAILLLVVAAGFLVEGLIHRSRPSWITALATRVMSIIGFILLVAVGINLGQDGAWDDVQAELTAPPLPTHGAAAPGSPDIFVFLLDAYPGDHAAALGTDFDADAFPTALTERGFDVDRDSHSNYLLTPLTLATMLNMRHLADIPGLGPPYGDRPTDWRRLRDAVNDSTVFATLREAGYETVSIDGGYAHAHMDRVDRFVAQPTPPELELALINNLRVGSIIETLAPGALAGLARQRIEDVFETTKQVADEPHDRPRMVFVHVPAPHPPWVFDAEGKPENPSFVSVVGDYSLTTQQAIDAGLAQATHIGRLATDAVDAVIASEPTATIVVFSDHGPPVGFAFEDPLSKSTDDRASNFMAARTPGHPGLIGDHMTPVNVFPALLDAYLGIDVVRQPDSVFAWRDSYLDVVEVPVTGQAR